MEQKEKEKGKREDVGWLEADEETEETDRRRKGQIEERRSGRAIKHSGEKRVNRDKNKALA